MTEAPTYRTFLFNSAGWCPNNAECSLIIYPQVCMGKKAEEVAQWFDGRFGKNGWPPAWRYTVYDFAHFHSNTHEVLGVFQGHAIICFGDTTGEKLKISTGDAVLIPAGVSHQLLEGSADFSAVGAYPEGFQPDQIRKGDSAGNFDDAIRHVPLPAKDPLVGGMGPLQAEWKQD